MIETVVSVELPVDERLLIRKQRILPIRPLTGSEKRISIVTGTHGDELEGQYVCYEVGRIINENRQHLKGIVDLYPALNPLGIASITRGIPGFDLDMNRIFPGAEDGTMSEHVASRIVKELTGSDICIDIHASNIYLTEVPQVRISEQTAQRLVPLAKHLNVDFIWVHSAATVLEATLAHTMNAAGVPTLVVEMGVGMRITESYCRQLTAGIFNLMSKMGIWDGETTEPRTPLISTDPADVSFINASAAGIFVPRVSHNTRVKSGELMGEIVDPLRSEVLDSIYAPCDGLVFTIREFPVVDEGSLIARILGGDAR
ncbi:MAG: M14 family metallopeptidase [Anaerovoracaceae bacterium]